VFSNIDFIHPPHGLGNKQICPCLSVHPTGHLAVCIPKFVWDLNLNSKRARAIKLSKNIYWHVNLPTSRFSHPNNQGQGHTWRSKVNCVSSVNLLGHPCPMDMYQVESVSDKSSLTLI